MARRGTAILLRMLFSLALIVAAWPLKASPVACASTAPKKAAPKVACAMPCCAERVMPGCMEEAPVKAMAPQVRERVHTVLLGDEPRGTSNPCGCALESAPLAPPASAKATLPSFGEHGQAILAAVPTLWPSNLPQVEPGIVGLDSGPPPGVFRRSDASRAPPVVRA